MWQKEPPTEEGYYWFKQDHPEIPIWSTEPKCELKLVWVWKSWLTETHFISYVGNEEPNKVSEVTGEWWSERIKEPE